MYENPAHEQSVAACELLLETADAVARRCEAADIPFSPELYRRIFALAYALLHRRIPGAVTREFALLALAGALGAEDKSAAQRLSDGFLRDVDRAVSAAAGDMSRLLLGEDHPALPIAIEELERLGGRLPSPPDSRETARQADRIITACVKFVKNAQEARRYRFTDAKYARYYACFLAQLIFRGLPVLDLAPEFFALAAVAVGADTPSRRAAMEYKFYRALSTCLEQYKLADLPRARTLAVTFAETGRLDGGRISRELLQIGQRAAEILDRVIADLPQNAGF